nr:transposase [Paenibacillus periandrae]
MTGEHVVFSYHDKMSGEEKTEKVTVEESIALVIRHILDENLKRFGITVSIHVGSKIYVKKW